ncbi:MAG: heme ABC transporter ATP-binding protein [Paracoccus sp. (in: a-proteobacteria)]|uniref:heme ABC transporter ATP-binding protein n=1 Tax=Paracoccus sp. TaxID=267 RepID=UPI003918B151
MSLCARNLHITLSGRPVLHGVDLTAPAGRVTAIIGPNGSGKTTLLRALTGEVAPACGGVTLNGRDIGGQTPQALARQRAVLPQHSALSFPFTAAEVVRIALESLPMPEPERAALIRRALARVGLSGHAGRLWQTMSGGEQQRVQLARALAQIWAPPGEMGEAGGPRWLLLDEPVSSLDIAHQLAVMHLARDHAADGGATVAVMHDLNLTAMFADHVLLLRDGRVLAEGPPDLVLTDPLLERAYGCALRILHAPETGVWLLPQSAA